MPATALQANVVLFPAPIRQRLDILRRRELASDIAKLKELASQLEAVRRELPDAAIAFDQATLDTCGTDPNLRKIGLDRRTEALAVGIQNLIQIMSVQHAAL
ncbi:hypothetical protein [Methylobacterium isbiliense]|uniref:Uncharacterized protein n=1 Tax=Methylobacterium isbiliense TaxID=315478 RepID=A0ABQ4SIA9_9HYPH|nr:hypothetical protein [Methylobacterium isbiliense]MDN3627221.1 hypothetical protein [Methylobacterium isbiliense]GJE02872.1 hypothetical protein GMJLKIPL_4821 [Methylobacterium isbiliense]